MIFIITSHVSYSTARSRKSDGTRNEKDKQINDPTRSTSTKSTSTRRRYLNASRQKKKRAKQQKQTRRRGTFSEGVALMDCKMKEQNKLLNKFLGGIPTVYWHTNLDFEPANKWLRNKVIQATPGI